MPEATPSPSPEPPRFSIPLPRPLWIFLATVVLVALAAGFVIGRPIYREQKAILEIERVGGKIGDRLPPPEQKRHWLRDLMGWRGCDITGVSLAETDADDETLARITGLSNLTTLRLASTRITNAGLMHLKVLKKLRFVDVRQTSITYDGGKDLEEFLPGVFIFPLPVPDGYEYDSERKRWGPPG